MQFYLVFSHRNVKNTNLRTDSPIKCRRKSSLIPSMWILFIISERPSRALQSTFERDIIIIDSGE